MNTVKRFFQEDIPAVFSAGKWRINVLQLKSRLTQLEKQRNAALTELGNAAWQSRVKDERYAGVYGKLEELDGLLAETQHEIDEKQKVINQETEHFNATKLDFDTRLNSTQGQRQVAQQKLSQLQAAQKSIEARLNQVQTRIRQGSANVQTMQSQIGQLQASSQPDRDQRIASLQSTIASTQAQINQETPQIDSAKAELASNQAEQAPVQKDIEGYNQLLSMLQQQSRSTLTGLQEALKQRQQDLAKTTEEKNGLLSQIAALMPDLGSQAYQYRPASSALSAAYAKVDGLNNEVREVNDQINLTQARLSSLNSRSLQKVLLAGGALLLMLLCLVAFVTFAVPTISNALKPNPKRDIRLVQSWTLENCSTGSGDYLDISVWENRRRDASASVDTQTKLIGAKDVILDSGRSHLEIAPNGLGVSLANLNSKDSRVQEVVRSVDSVHFDETSLTRPKQLDIKTSFEKTQSSDNVALTIEISNNSDFGLIFADTPYAFVINRDGEVIDILAGSINSSTLGVDSMSKIQFQGLSAYGGAACLQTDYSNEPVTFWYFVPMQYATESSEQFMISDKVSFKP